MFFLYPSEPNKEISKIAVALSFPNFMLGFIICHLIIKQKNGKHLKLLIITSGGLGILSFFFDLLILNDNTLLLCQLLILVFQSAFMSFTEGIMDAISEADIESRFPLVEITTTLGENITDLRFSRNTNSDYRFINSDGTECIFPREHIFRIKMLEEKHRRI